MVHPIYENCFQGQDHLFKIGHELIRGVFFAVFRSSFFTVRFSRFFAVRFSMFFAVRFLRFVFRGFSRFVFRVFSRFVFRGSFFVQMTSFEALIKTKSTES